MKLKQIGLVLLGLISTITVMSQSYYRSDTNKIKFLSTTSISSQPTSSSSLDSVYFETADFYSFTGADTISFKHKVTNSSGTMQMVKVQLIDASSVVVKTLYTWTYASSNSNDILAPIFVSSIGDYKVRFSSYRQGGNSTQKFVITDVNIVTPLVALSSKPVVKRKAPVVVQDDEESIQIFNSWGRLVFEGGLKDFIKNWAESGQVYFTDRGYKFMKN